MIAYNDDGSFKVLVLAIDAGASSGWAISDSNDLDKLLASGTASSSSERLHSVKLAKSLAATTNLPLVVVAEAWAGRWQSPKSAMGLGMQMGRWLESIELHLGIKESEVLRVNTSTWRYGIWSPELVREAAAHKKEGGYKKLACAFTDIAQDDEAEAACILVWAQSSIEVQEAVRKMYH